MSTFTVGGRMLLPLASLVSASWMAGKRRWHIISSLSDASFSAIQCHPRVADVTVIAFYT